jgi:predicted GNAT superfamily acetyltransferase
MGTVRDLMRPARLVEPAGVVDSARVAAEAAAARAGVAVRPAADQGEARRAADLWAAVWGPISGQLVTPELAWALADSGNYVANAWADGEVVGASLGFRAVDRDGAHLHSHIAGVLGAWQGRSVGYALKLHQRWWALASGLDRVVWTFDPLVARNAYFNVTKLGAALDRFDPDFYGPIADAVNGDDETDRCRVLWRLTTQRVIDAVEGRAPAPQVAGLLAAGAPVVLRCDDAGRPVLGRADADGTMLCQVPRDILPMRRTEPDLARSWRRTLRSVFTDAFSGGYRVSEVDRNGWYVFSADERP